MYCRYSNNNGYTDTKSAQITVYRDPNATPAPAATSILPDTETPSTISVVSGYNGTWQDEVSKRATMTVDENGDGTYSIEITWGNGAASSEVWTMTAIDMGNGTWMYRDCSHVTENWLSEEISNSETVAENGTGFFDVVETGNTVKLVWTDYSSGLGCTFIHVA